MKSVQTGPSFRVYFHSDGDGEEEEEEEEGEDGVDYTFPALAIDSVATENASQRVGMTPTQPLPSQKPTTTTTTTTSATTPAAQQKAPPRAQAQQQPEHTQNGVPAAREKSQPLPSPVQLLHQSSTPRVSQGAPSLTPTQRMTATTQPAPQRVGAGPSSGSSGQKPAPATAARMASASSHNSNIGAPGAIPVRRATPQTQPSAASADQPRPHGGGGSQPVPRASGTRATPTGPSAVQQQRLPPRVPSAGASQGVTAQRTGSGQVAHPASAHVGGAMHAKPTTTQARAQAARRMHPHAAAMTARAASLPPTQTPREPLHQLASQTQQLPQPLSQTQRARSCTYELPSSRAAKWTESARQHNKVPAAEQFLQGCVFYLAEDDIELPLDKTWEQLAHNLVSLGGGMGPGFWSFCCRCL